MADTNLPLAIFPGFTTIGTVSGQVREIAVSFNAEGINALSEIPEESILWADVGTRVTPAWFEAKIPVALTSLLGFAPFKGERSYHTAGTAAVSVKTSPWDEGIEWPAQFLESGNVQLAGFYGLQDFPRNIVQHARALKADMLASLMLAGQTYVIGSTTYTASALTLDQPGYVGGLPLFSDGSTSGAAKHYSNPLDKASKQFANLTVNAGKLDNPDVYSQMLVDMQQVPHPTKLNMNLGLGVTDIIGGTAMRPVFQRAAVQQLQLQAGTGSAVASVAAVSNIYTQEAMLRAAQQISAAGMTPIRYWIAPQLDSHPYIVAYPTRQMWFAVSKNRAGSSWAEFAAPTKEFTPKVTLLGDGSEEARKTRKVRLFADIDAGVAAGLPHFIHAYFESVTTS
jgi:hypothetical protein